MTLVTGTKLGPYEIVGAIGAGGTDEVYGAYSSTSRARASRCLGCGIRRSARIAAAYGCEMPRVEDMAGTVIPARRA